MHAVFCMYYVTYQVWALEMLKLLLETKQLWSKASLRQLFSLKKFKESFFEKFNDLID